MAGPISPHYILSTLPIGIIIRFPGKFVLHFWACWSKLKYMTGRKVKQINNITTEQWLEHSEKLFNSGVESDANHENDFDITLDEPNDEVKDHLF